MQVASAMTMGAVGTLHYTAPEMMRSHHYNEKALRDCETLFSFFCRWISMPLGSSCTSCAPVARPSSSCLPRRLLLLAFFSCQAVVDLYEKGEEPRPDVADCTRPLRGLMQRCWAVEPTQRPAAEEILAELEAVEPGSCCAAM